jgi:IPT/TIG domain-containing protein
MKLLCVLLLTTLTFGCGYGSNYSSTNGSQPSSTPSVSSLSPASTAAGGTAFVLTVNGSNFASNSVIYWNSTALSTTYVSGQQLTANIVAADIATAGNASVYVNNPGTGMYASGVNSATMSFTITN